MSKEIYISTTPHETRLAIVEDEQLAEIYYERENEYTLAGSIYNGKVTRVLPGMQSSFVDIGLERDAFLYVTDFMEEQGDAADFDSDGGSKRAQAPREGSRDESRPERSEGRRGRGDRGSRDRHRPAAEPVGETPSFEEPVAPRPTEASGVVEDSNEASLDEQGSRRWRGRRGRRRGRGQREAESSTAEVASGTYAESVGPELLGSDAETIVIEGSSDDEATGQPIEINLEAEPVAQESYPGSAQGRAGRRDRGRGRDRGSRGDRDNRDDRRPAFSTSTGPVESAYGEEADAPAGGAAVLPGESIRKYRDPEEVAREEAEKAANAPAVATVTAVAAPSVEISGWDGGAVLPGETLSRHRGRGERPSQPSASLRAADVKNYADSAALTPVAVPPAIAAPQQDASEPTHSAEAIAPTPIPDSEDIAPAAAPEETGGLTQHPTHADAHTAVEPVAPSAEEVVAAAEADAPTPDAGEYEPEEGESASIGDASRRDFRRLKQRPEPEPEPQEDEVIAATPDATTYDLQSPEADNSIVEAEHSAEAADAPQAHEFTAMQPTGELLSDVAPETGETYQHLPQTQDAEYTHSPVDDEGAVQSVALSEAELVPEPVSTSDSQAEAGQQENGAVPQVHAYGDGDLEEEEVDGDEYEFDLAVASLDDEEFEEYEEETLDETADLGSVLHEMSTDEVALADDTEDEEYEAAPDTGGFSVDDFGGEPEEESETAPSETAGQGERRGRRDSRRGGRDRDRKPGGGFRGGAGGDRGRGRGRQSVQTMDLPAINELLKPGQEILLQIAKEPIAKKGARVTSHIALPGRFLVFMPTVNHTGVSRKISSDEERRRLKSILLSEKGDAQGGFIVRTAADGASEEELRNDLRFLIQLWQDIKTRSESSKSPALIYHDLSLIERILRDQVTDNFSAIWVDTEGEYERVLRFLQRFQPSLVRRVKLYTKETPLFEHFGVTQEIDKALKSKVWLKSGGSIVIDQTEALVAIDINTGKYVGKTARLEDTILKTNLDAIPEIVRQIRLRDLGGIIVIDFIDMDERKNRAKVMQVLEDELKSDRAPSKVLPFNDFGLVIMTRKRVKQSLERTLCIPDPVTEGTGMIKSPITVANEIYIEMRKMHRHLEKGDVMLRVHPEVVKTLKAAGGKRLQELEEMTHKTILVKSDPALNPEQFDIH